MRNERRSERAVKKICLTLGAFYKRASIRTFIYRVYNNTKGEKTQSFKHKICRRPSKNHMTKKPTPATGIILCRFIKKNAKKIAIWQKMVYTHNRKKYFIGGTDQCR